jgi:hypothetical protein
MSKETEKPNDDAVPDDAAADFGLQTSSFVISDEPDWRQY